MMIAGALTIITAVFMESSFGAAMTALGYIIFASIFTVIYAHKVYVQEKENEKGRQA
mgnify:CR=1 FL=1